MKKYTFQSEKDTNNKYDTTNVIMITESDSLGDLLEAFECFLKANTFAFKGRVDIVDDDE